MSRYGHDPIDFGSLDDDYRGYEERPAEGGRGPLILALAAGVLIVFAAVVWNTYRQGVRTDEGPLPVITADNGEYKRRPDQAGGMVVPNQDRRIYDAFETETTPDPGVLVEPAPEGQPETLSGGPAEMETASAESLAREPGAAELRRLTAIDEPAASASSGPVSEIGAADVVAQPRLPVADPESVAQFSFSNDGSYLVQIAALRDEAGALRAWNDAISAHPSIFEGAAQSVQRADLGSKGVFYRLRAGRFDSRETASAFCAALKQVGRDCIVVR